MKEMIKINGITKSYDGIRNVVDELSLSIPNGSVFGFLGPNGSGKTTTIKMLVGINKPDSGTIQIDERNPALNETKQNIGFMPEEPNYYGQLTGLEFIKFASDLFKSNQTKNKNLEETLIQTGIYEARNSKIKTYSKGMKQRLGFAQAIINNPEFVFLDEPLDGLDPLGRRELKKMVENLKSQGKTIFFNSHILADVESLCDQIGIIHRGTLAYSGDVETFKKSMSLEDRFVELITNLEQ